MSKLKCKLWWCRYVNDELTLHNAIRASFSALSWVNKWVNNDKI